MKIKIKQKPSKKDYEHLLNRTIETLDDTIKLANEDLCFETYGTALGHWQVLDSLNNAMWLDGIEANKDLDKIIDDYYKLLDTMYKTIKK